MQGCLHFYFYFISLPFLFNLVIQDVFLVFWSPSNIGNDGSLGDGGMGGCSGDMDGLGQWCLKDGVGVVMVAIVVGLVVILLRLVTTSSPRFHLARGTSFYSF